MPIFTRREDYYRHFTAVDIGTDMVKALVVRRDRGAGTILGVGREPQEAAAMSGGAVADIESVIRAANRALEAAEDMAGLNPPPGQVVVGIAGELVKGFSSTASYNRQKPESRVREPELRSLLTVLQKRALREAQHLLELERGFGSLEARLVYSAVTNVRLDGRTVPSPVGHDGGVLELTVFNTFAPLTHIAAIDSVVTELDLELLGSVAQPYAIARACAATGMANRGGIFIDIGAGTTDVALHRHGGVEGTRMFGLGGRAFTRRLQTALGLTFEQAEARKLRHSEGLLPADEDRRITDLFTVDTEVMVRGLALCLEELARGEKLPPSVYLCGGGSLLPEVMAELSRPGWAAELDFAGAPEVQFLAPEDLALVKDATGLLTGPRDIGPLALAHHGLVLEAEEKEVVHTVMRRMLKGMRS